MILRQILPAPAGIAAVYAYIIPDEHDVPVWRTPVLYVGLVDDPERGQRATVWLISGGGYLDHGDGVLINPDDPNHSDHEDFLGYEYDGQPYDWTFVLAHRKKKLAEKELAV